MILEDRFEELGELELCSVNGGSCTGGGCTSGGYAGGSCTSASYTTGSCTTTDSCGNEGKQETIYISCGGCFISNSNIPRNPTNPKLPAKEIWVGTGDHCDIYAWNLAIGNGVDPRNGKTTIPNLNNITVNDFYNKYCENDSKPLTEDGCANQKGFVFFDWGGNNASNQDGIYEHVEFCKFSSDGSSYTIYENNGQSMPIPKVYKTASDSNGQGGFGTKAVFVPLN